MVQTVPMDIDTGGTGMSKKKPKKQAKVKKVMHEYKAGKLKSGKIGPGKGPKVKSKRQALAIALQEAGISKKKKKKR